MPAGWASAPTTPSGPAGTNGLALSDSLMAPAIDGMINKIAIDSNAEMATVLEDNNGVNGGVQRCVSPPLLAMFANTADSININAPIGKTIKLANKFLNQLEKADDPGSASTINCTGEKISARIICI